MSSLEYMRGDKEIRERHRTNTVMDRLEKEDNQVKQQPVDYQGD